MKQLKPYVLDIIDGIDAILSYRSGTDAEFMDDRKTQDAILMRLQDIGENLIHIRDTFPVIWDDNATDEWVRAIGLRNIISHGTQMSTSRSSGFLSAIICHHSGGLSRSCFSYYVARRVFTL